MRIFIIICELCACLKIWVNLTTDKTSESIKLANTAPGPTDGNWSISPTKITTQVSSIAFNNEFIKDISNMLASSKIKQSHNNGKS